MLPEAVSVVAHDHMLISSWSKRLHVIHIGHIIFPIRWLASCVVPQLLMFEFLTQNCLRLLAIPAFWCTWGLCDCSNRRAGPREWWLCKLLGNPSLRFPSSVRVFDFDRLLVQLLVHVLKFLKTKWALDDAAKLKKSDSTSAGSKAVTECEVTHSENVLYIRQTQFEDIIANEWNHIETKSVKEDVVFAILGLLGCEIVWLKHGTKNLLDLRQACSIERNIQRKSWYLWLKSGFISKRTLCLWAIGSAAFKQKLVSLFMICSCLLQKLRLSWKDATVLYLHNEFPYFDENIL